MPVAMGYVIEEEDATPRSNDSTMISTPRGSQVCPDSLVEELMRQTLDSSKSEIGILRDLTQE